MNSLLGMALTFIPMFALMYFLLILPEKKRSKKYNEMLGSLQVNDEVLTRGGIFGKIIKIEEDYMIIETSADRTKLKVAKNAVGSKLNVTE